MFILYSVSSGLEFWSVNHTSIYESSKLNVLKNIKTLGEISNNWSNDLLGMNACKTLEFLLIIIAYKLQLANTTSVICILDTFSPIWFLSF